MTKLIIYGFQTVKVGKDHDSLFTLVFVIAESFTKFLKKSPSIVATRQSVLP